MSDYDAEAEALAQQRHCRGGGTVTIGGDTICRECARDLARRAHAAGVAAGREGMREAVAAIVRTHRLSVAWRDTGVPADGFFRDAIRAIGTSTKPAKAKCAYGECINHGACNREDRCIAIPEDGDV